LAKSVGSKLLTNLPLLLCSVADPDPFDPDPSFHFDTDPDPDPAFQFDTDPDLTV
jgi:hypothetical protein